MATSTVRYYERVGLLAAPARTTAGYRDYTEDDAARLLFVSRGRRMGLTCEQIGELLPIWDGTNCSAAHERVGHLIETKQAEIAARVEELRAFGAQLALVRSALASSPPPAVCSTDLSCCVPETIAPGPVAVELVPRARSV